MYVLKRPHVDEFLKRMGELFECVLFTASLAKVRNDCVAASVQRVQNHMFLDLAFNFRFAETVQVTLNQIDSQREIWSLQQPLMESDAAEQDMHKIFSHFE